MKYFKYKITYWADYDADEHTDEGIIAAKNYGQAAENLVRDYGEKDTTDIFLREICIDGDYCLSKEELEYIFKENITE